MNVGFKKYRYEGPVFNVSGDYIFYGDYVTTAKSELKALSNIRFRAARDVGKPVGVIRLDDGSIYKIEEPEKVPKKKEEKEEFHQITLKEYFGEY